MYLPAHMFLVRFIFCISVSEDDKKLALFLTMVFQKQIILYLVETSCRTRGINNSLGWERGCWIEILWLIMECQNSHCWCMGPLSILEMTLGRATISLVLKYCDWGKVLTRTFSISWYLKVPCWPVALFKGDLRPAWKSSCPQRRRPEHFSRGRAAQDPSCQNEMRRKIGIFLACVLRCLFSEEDRVRLVCFPLE